MKKFISLLVAVTFMLSSFSVYAQQPFDVGFSHLVPLSGSFSPVMLKGMVIYPQNPLMIDFAIDQGQEDMDEETLKKQTIELIQYFLAGLTIPQKDLWVNLSPVEPERMIDAVLAQTDLGQGLLAQDYVLKQVASSLLFPEGDVGREFWKRIYANAQQKLGTTEIPTDVLNKVWIMPDIAKIYRLGDKIVIADMRLKVLLEKDYLASIETKNESLVEDGVVEQVLRDVMIPVLEKEVNEGKNFAQIRQIFSALILSNYYKNQIKESILTQVYANQHKTQGIEVFDAKKQAEVLYQKYMEVFKKGVFNYIKEELDLTTQEVIPRKYFSGGVIGDMKVEEVGSALEVKEPKGKVLLIKTELERSQEDESQQDASQDEFVVWSEQQYVEAQIDAMVQMQELKKKLASQVGHWGIVNVDLFNVDEDTVIRAVKAGKIIKLDLRRLYDLSEKELGDRNHLEFVVYKFEQFSRLFTSNFSRYFPGFDYFDSDPFFVQELLQNAFGRWANCYDEFLPIFFWPQLAKQKIEVFSASKNIDKKEIRWQSLAKTAMEAGLLGQGHWISMVRKKKLRYFIEEMFDEEEGNTISRKTVVMYDPQRRSALEKTQKMEEILRQEGEIVSFDLMNFEVEKQKVIDAMREGKMLRLDTSALYYTWKLSKLGLGQHVFRMERLKAFLNMFQEVFPSIIGDKQRQLVSELLQKAVGKDAHEFDEQLPIFFRFHPQTHRLEVVHTIKEYNIETTTQADRILRGMQEKSQSLVGKKPFYHFLNAVSADHQQEDILDADGSLVGIREVVSSRFGKEDEEKDSLSTTGGIDFREYGFVQVMDASNDQMMWSFDQASIELLKRDLQGLKPVLIGDFQEIQFSIFK